MSYVQHLIYLNIDDGSEQIWKEYFKETDKANFSEWIRLKLKEEKQKRGDKDFIYKKLSECENETAYWKKQLIKSEEIELANNQALAEKEANNLDNYTAQMNKVESRVNAFLTTYFICKKIPSEQERKVLAKEFISLGDPNNLNKLLDFLESKGFKRKEIKRREVTI